MVATVIDSDQHMFERADTWREHIDPGARDDALTLEEDELGYAWLTWRGERLGVADLHQPGDVESIGRTRQRLRAGQPPEFDYFADLPASYWDPTARVAWLDEIGVDEAVCFPNYGLLWERRLSGDLTALTANMAAWNRWCAAIRTDGDRRLHPVAHLTLRDPEWVRAQLAELARADIGLAMIAPSPVDGRPMSHPAHDPLWAAFIEHGVTPVFHVADQPRVFDDCWYQEDPLAVPVIESAFLWVPPALALSDLILNGVFDRFPALRIGVVELSSIWVPQFLLMIDGAADFTTRMNGRPLAELIMRPHEYFLEHVRVSSFCYEDPLRLTAKSGDVFMFCSDFPHSEGTATPVADYERAGCEPSWAPGLYHANFSYLLGR